MKSISEKLHSLQNLRNKKDEISKQEKELSKPVLVDISYLDIILNQFESITGGNATNSVEYRQAFVLIVLMLYAPSSLIGDKMPQGLCSNIAKTLRLKKGHKV